LLNLPLVHPFTTGFGTISSKETVLVKITDQDGVDGWGEGAALSFPNYSPETSGTTYLGLVEYLLPALIGKKVSQPEEMVSSLSGIKGFNFAKTAIDCAVWMIWSLRSGTSLSDLFGGSRDKIEVGESIGIKESVKETLKEVELRLSQGYRRIKVKIKPGWDLEVVKSIRERFDQIPLMVDANSAYSLKDTNTLKALDQFSLLMLEQPLGDTDIIDHATLQRQIKTPICLDESILSVDDARKAVEIGACRVINIKPGRVGGITEAKKIHDYCRRKKIGVWCGGLLESGIGRAYNIALSALTGFTYPADMSPSAFFYEEDLIDPTYEVDADGFIKVPDKPGLGFKLDLERINKYTVKKQST